MALYGAHLILSTSRDLQVLSMPVAGCGHRSAELAPSASIVIGFE